MSAVRRTIPSSGLPFDGVVSKKYTEVGELLLPGKQIVTIVNPDKIYVLATIDEVDVGRLSLGPAGDDHRSTPFREKNLPGRSSGFRRS